MEFNPVKALEQAGITDFYVDYKTRTVYVEDLNKLATSLKLPERERTYMMYKGWNLVQGLPEKERPAITLPTVDWKGHNWTIPGQIKKILEEAGEVAEAVAEADPINTIREALDTMQTCDTLINMVQAEWNLPLEKFLQEHTEKLDRKGYLKDMGGEL